ncbi:hypothetical protein PPL_01865 [Heterostelium album PN500]|uniref:Protein FRA10AC1 n=1 Tax=Heterostelium pallidum (strain ATCC 26659 / Pp 5 / PN500) TaxID=670386 RepID=D3B0P8_HETP5|nr:hypothetical protein PPL_01865 [Heterostelium album PN500]EFA84872.1 hypothetical protein PPL_01865 [Heterostelium album PN500]|eukprot:XP_020436983.1 hypothetical protein PPL_01865 [Heterostelium album PN500]
MEKEKDLKLKQHNKYIGDYIKYYKNANTTTTTTTTTTSRNNNSYAGYKSDLDTLKEYHQFIRDEDEDEDKDTDSQHNSWERRLAKKYYDRLFKEYAIIDLSRYETGQVGMRWRTESEVFSGKGQLRAVKKRLHWSKWYCVTSVQSCSTTPTSKRKRENLKS